MVCVGGMNSKAKALAAAKKRILALQSQMTKRILQIAAEVEKLTEIATEDETREFLRVTCNVPSSELATYVAFGETLKGYEALLHDARVSFPVMKALVAADEDTRNEVLERMVIGARIDVREISAIRKRLRDAQLTPFQVLAKRNAKLVTAAARKRGGEAGEHFKSDLQSFLDGIVDEHKTERLASSDIRVKAGRLLKEFESLFGQEHPDPTKIKAGSSRHALATAHRTLVRLKQGTLIDENVGRKLVRQRHPGFLPLFHLSGKALGEYKDDRVKVRQVPPQHHRLKVLEICGGAGGMALGLESAGFEHVALIEWDKKAAATLRKNRADWNVLEEDIRKIDFRPYRKTGIDLLAGGPPCQPYSADGFGRGKDDPRDLLPECVRVVSEVKPRAFVFENVEGLLHERHADHIAAILRGFRKAGYAADIYRIRAEHYGVAQERGRVLIIGVRRELAGAFRMPPTFPERRSNLGDALVDLMAANGWEGAYEWARERREQPVFDPKGNIIARGVLASAMVTSRGKRRPNETARWAGKGVDIASLRDEAPTSTQGTLKGFRPALTARMCARLQDFPDNWEFCGGKEATATQIGNAVPRRLAQAVGLALFSAMKDVIWDWEAMLWPAKTRVGIPAPPLVPDEIPLGKKAEMLGTSRELMS
ncbi:DNA (cytosine-5)-methyltransferase 1 [Rhizobium sp. BK376]|nr:DNA (cytosine-5)-methyltransferase 1 [Rhizobium sp. BK376]